MHIFLYLYCLDEPLEDGSVFPVAHPTDYEPFATLVCATSFADARQYVSMWGDVFVYKLGVAVMGMKPGVILTTYTDVLEIKRGLLKHPRHQVRRA